MLLKATRRIRKYLQKILFGDNKSPFFDSTYNEFDEGNNALNLEAHLIAKAVLNGKIKDKEIKKTVLNELTSSGYTESILIGISEDSFWNKLIEGSKAVIKDLEDEITKENEKKKVLFTENINTFGEFIHAKRKQAGLTITALADAMGLSTTYISDVEKDRRKPFNYRNMLLFAEIARLNTEEITQMFDFDAEEREYLPVDVQRYIFANGYLVDYIRKIKSYNIDEKRLNNSLKRMKKTS